VTRWEDAEPVTFTRSRSTRDPLAEVFTVDTAPEVTVVCGEILDQCAERKRWGEPCPIEVSEDGTLIRWRFANCWCAYRIVDYSHPRDQYLCERLAAMGGTP